jgi:hypothetical protein
MDQQGAQLLGVLKYSDTLSPEDINLEGMGPDALGGKPSTELIQHQVGNLAWGNFKILATFRSEITDGLTS